MSMPANILDKRAVRIGFIGLGLMGSRLTRRLHSAGWNIQAWNRSPEPGRCAEGRGCNDCSHPWPSSSFDSDVILSSLANDEAVYSVYFGPERRLFCGRARNHHS